MPFSAPRIHLQDILDSIGLIDAFVQGMDFEGYKSDLKTQSAVERQLQIITEAAYRLGEDAAIVCPGPDRKGVRGMGNFLRHEYHKVDDKIIWDTVKTYLPALGEAVAQALAAMR